ncbi:MAG: PEP-CTERM sorting domain-containing protein [Verrucomicrobiota bacterium]
MYFTRLFLLISVSILGAHGLSSAALVVTTSPSDGIGVGITDNFDNPDFLGAGASAGGNSTTNSTGTTSNFVNGDGTLNSDTWSITSTDSTTFQGSSAVAGADPGASGIYAFTGPGVSTLGFHQGTVSGIHTTEAILHLVNGNAGSEVSWKVEFDIWLQNTVADAAATLTNFGFSLTGTPGSFTAVNTGNVTGTAFGSPDTNWDQSTHSFTFRPNGTTGIGSGGDLYLLWQIEQANFSAGSGDLLAIGSVTVTVPEPSHIIMLSGLLLLMGGIGYSRFRKGKSAAGTSD